MVARRITDSIEWVFTELKGNAMSRQQAIDYLKSVHTRMAEQVDFSPENPVINTTLGTLVRTLCDWQTFDDLATIDLDPEVAPLLTDLPRLCACAECEMEKWWCRKILSDMQTETCPANRALAAFWYMDNYRELYTAERALMTDAQHNKAAFLGSGALPLTAILMAEADPTASIRCVDMDAIACDLSRQLIEALDLSDRIEVICASAQSYIPRADETVICASLLSGAGIYDHLLDHGVRTLLVRDAEGLFRLLYKPAVLPTNGYVERAKTQPCHTRINTSRLFERAA